MATLSKVKVWIILKSNNMHNFGGLRNLVYLLKLPFNETKVAQAFCLIKAWPFAVHCLYHQIYLMYYFFTLSFLTGSVKLIAKAFLYSNRSTRFCFVIWFDGQMVLSRFKFECFPDGCQLTLAFIIPFCKVFSFTSTVFTSHGLFPSQKLSLAYGYRKIFSIFLDSSTSPSRSDDHLLERKRCTLNEG